MAASQEQALQPRRAAELLEQVEGNIHRVIVGKDRVVRLALAGLVAGGHVLLQDLPGTGKTMLAQRIPGILPPLTRSESLETTFTAAFIRINPVNFEDAIAAASLQPRSMDAREFRHADELFRDDAQKSFVIDLGDLSRDNWSLLPGAGDFIAELHTRKYDTLTYALCHCDSGRRITSNALGRF